MAQKCSLWFLTSFPSCVLCNQSHFICPGVKVTGRSATQLGFCPLFLVQVCEYSLALSDGTGEVALSLAGPVPNPQLLVAHPIYQAPVLGSPGARYAVCTVPVWPRIETCKGICADIKQLSRAEKIGCKIQLLPELLIAK